MSVVLAELGRTPEAIAAARRALSINHDYADAHYNLGNALMQAGRTPTMEGAQAIRIKRDYAQTHVNLGAALNVSGRPDEAVEEYREALRIAPERPKAHYDLGRCLRASQRVPPAAGMTWRGFDRT